jgi:hypothetical protein
VIGWKAGRVVRQIERRGTLQEVEVLTEDGTTEKAIHDAAATSPVRPGDRIVMNATAAFLNLGSGGCHFIHHRVDDDTPPLPRRFPGHIVKLRYTPLQRAVLAAEEPASPYHDLFRERRRLDGMPVLIGELHSMLPAAACWMHNATGRRPPRVGYVMSDGGALPIDYSRHVVMLKRIGWLCGTVTYGHAYGGDLDAVNKFTALIASRHILRADVVVVAMGPGIVGTGTPYGHTGTEVAELVHAVRALGGIPVVIPRISFADRRERHRGVSHHTLNVLGTLTLTRAVVPFPADLPPDGKALIERQWRDSGCADRHDIRWVDGITVEEIARRMRDYPLPIRTMGRGLNEDPAFFAACCAAAEYAVRLLGYDG